MTAVRRLGVIWLVIMGLVGWVALATAHQDPCHRRHSCPSDHGTYICGDLGYCSQCPDNAHCLAGQPRAAARPPATLDTPAPAPAQMLTVQRVIDRDTMKLSTGETVRLIGVDTPETKDPRKPVQYFGKEATAFTQRLVEGKRVRLESDQQRVDKYGRTLAYVYLDDGTFVNAELIKQGHGLRTPGSPSRIWSSSAREAGRGLWGAR
jgi:micrococcal nuclease